MNTKTPDAVASKAELCWHVCEELRLDYLRRLRIERAKPDGFLKFGNEIRRAAALDRMIEDVEKIGCRHRQHNTQVQP